MKRKLLTQITNEWRSNLWLLFELLAVSVMIWYIADFTATQFTRINMPMGIEADNCHRIICSTVPSDSPDYQPDDSTMHTTAENYRNVIARLRANPQIEGVALLTSYSTPYTMNSSYDRIIEVDSPDSLQSISIPLRTVSPDYIRIFRIHGTNGETPDELANILARDEWLLAQDAMIYDRILANNTTFRDGKWIEYYQKSLTSDKSYLIGHRFRYVWSDSISHRIGAIIPPLKRHEYEIPNGGVVTLLNESDDNQILSASIIARFRPGNAENITNELLTNSTTLYRSGNVYLSIVNSLADMRELIQSESSTTLRNYAVIMVFLLVSVFLGLLGTFWFRTQQRTAEIAIRIVNGATRVGIFSRLISEGLLLLTIVTPLAIGFDWLLCHYELNSCVYEWDFFEPVRFIATIIVSYLLMALIIILGILFPAYRAMNVDPAITLKDE